MKIDQARRIASRRIRVTTTCLWILIFPGLANAAPLTLEFEVTLNQTTVGSNNDVAGMDGATVAFTATFNSGATWQDAGFGGGEVFAVADSHSFTITGASVVASNGVYSDPDGFSIDSFPGGEILFLSLPFLNFDFPEVALGSGHAFQLGFSLTAASGAAHPVAGDGIDTSHFPNTFTGFTTVTDTLASSSPNVNIYGENVVISAPTASGGPTPVDLKSFSIE